jgi:tRNA threonylcarbamoyladenosine biosynthesis protein TsaB
MLALGFDTATPWGTMALIEDEEVVFEISLKAGKGSGEYLLALLQTLFKKSQRKIADLNLIAVGTGPGSYTGIRVGLATAKGLVEGLNISTYGLSTLRIIAENARCVSGWIAPVIDARRGYVYTALYQNNADELMELEAPIVIPATEWALRISSFPTVMICGDGSKIHQATWSNYPNLKIAPVDWERPLGSAAARIGCKEFDLQSGTDLFQLIPCYLRKVEAEVLLEERLNAAQNRTDARRGS